MNQKPYSFYAAACLKSFFECTPTAGSAEVAETNRKACEATLKRLDTNTLLILHEVYTSNEILSMAVRRTSAKYDIEPVEMWKLIGQIEKDFAIHRGLL